jgi:hypothetical protein
MRLGNERMPAINTSPLILKKNRQALYIRLGEGCVSIKS